MMNNFNSTSFMSNNSYQNDLQQIYDYGKVNQDRALTFESAELLIESIETDFGSYKNVLVESVSGMTGVEAYLYLLEIMNTLDKDDGKTDRIIDTDDFTSAFKDAGFGNTGNDIAEHLYQSSLIFKEETDPKDAENIEYLKSTQGSNSNVLLGADAAITQHRDFTDYLGTTDPTLGNQANDLNFIHQILNLLPNHLSKFGQPTYGMPHFAQPTYGMPHFGQPTYGMPSFGQPTYGMPSFGEPTYGILPFEQPTYGMPPFEQPTYGIPHFGQPTYGIPPLGGHMDILQQIMQCL